LIITYGFRKVQFSSRPKGAELKTEFGKILQEFSSKSLLIVFSARKNRPLGRQYDAGIF